MELIDPEPRCFLTRAEFVKINEESIRLGLSRTMSSFREGQGASENVMPNECLVEIPAVIPIKGAWWHRSCWGQYNIRLEILIGPNFDKLFLWDVSVARWARIKTKAMAVMGP